MARLREVSFVLRKIGPTRFLKNIVREINDDGVMNMAAAVAFYWLLALFPFFIFLMSMLPLLPDRYRAGAKDRVTYWTESNLPPQARDTVIKNVTVVLDEPRGGLLSVGLLLTLWAASNGMNATMAALDACYDVKKPRPFIVQRGVAILMTIFMVLTVCVVLVLIPVATQVIRFVQANVDRFAASRATSAMFLAIDLLRYPLGLLLVVLLISAIYQYGVSVRRRWTFFTPGAVFTVFTVIVLAWGFNLYLQRFGAASYAKTYGALGGVIILLLLFYFYAVVFLIGAEINSEIDYEILGSKNDEAKDPLPKLFVTEDLDKFRKQLELRQAREHSPRRHGGTETRSKCAGQRNK